MNVADKGTQVCHQTRLQVHKGLLTIYLTNYWWSSGTAGDADLANGYPAEFWCDVVEVARQRE